MARHAVRAPVAEERVQETDDGAVLLEIPPDPRTGDTVLPLHPLEYIRRMSRLRHGYGAQADPGTRRPHGALLRGHANRLRSAYRDEEGDVAVRTADAGAASPSRAIWARLLHQAFEVDPLACARCGAVMRVISVITAPGLVDRLLRHVRGKNAADADPGGGRDPPAA